MQVILLQRVAKLGQMGEVVNVKDGYGVYEWLEKDKVYAGYWK